MHGTRRFSAVLLGSAILSAPATALAIRPDAQTATPELQVATGQPARRERTLSWDRVPDHALSAWSAFVSDAGAGWQSSWDHATGVPSQIFGKGIPAPGTVQSAAAAAAFSRMFLADHIDLLAPGDAPSDFRLVSNVLTGRTRVVGFFQYDRGMRVLGGQVSFRYKDDRLFVIASEALPHVDAPAPLAVVSSDDAQRGASQWISAHAAAAQPRAVDGPYVLPIVGSGGVRAYRTVVRVRVAAQSPLGLWDVYVDATTGKPVARRQRLQFGTAEIRYNVPDRWPGGSRSDYQARHADSTVDGNTTDTDGDGVVNWSGDSPAQVIEFARGTFADVHNKASGGDAVRSDRVLPNGVSVWDDRSDEFVDAQIDTFVHIGVAKAFARTFAPKLAWLSDDLTANVNINDVCNAYYDGSSINFFASSQDCGNTGRIADVVYHEFGHGVHDHSIVPGVGAFDGAFAEGQADFFATMITNDPGMGRGFFRDNKPLRDIDPPDKEYRWPDDIGEIHHTGLIFSGAMWDMRKLLIAKYGYDRGAALTARLYYAAIQRSVDIPSSYVEVLAADDNDGNLSNGTPDVCAINQAFGAHGLRSVSADVTGPGSVIPNQNGYPITLRVNGFKQCAGEQVTSARLFWRLPGTPADVQSVAMTSSGGAFQGVVAPQPAGIVEYQVKVVFADGSTTTFPQNRADPWFELYVGKVKTLYCTDFETNPFTHGWTHGLSNVQGAAGVDDWQWGAPTGGAGSGDPAAAHSGHDVIGNNLGLDGSNGFYQPNSDNYAESPKIIVGHYSDVHLQYWRRLNVEDGYFDHARIYANDSLVWQNLNGNSGSSSSTNHRDHQWRFHDVPLSSSIHGNTVQVKFELSSDSDLEFGGWNIDDFCIVADPSSICGDGVVTGAEQCDNGAANSDTQPNACRTNCEKAHCGDGVVDKGEACDDGNTDNNDGCTNLCELSTTDPSRTGCTCRVGSRGSPGPGTLFLFGVVVFGVARRRRRQRR